MTAEGQQDTSTPRSRYKLPCTARLGVLYSLANRFVYATFIAWPLGRPDSRDGLSSPGTFTTGFLF